jgi:glycosyltransferase involved in cell wall biosynthesis
MTTPILTLLTPGDSSLTSAWSGVPFGLAGGLEEAGVVVHRESFYPGLTGVRIRSYSLKVLVRVRRRLPAVADALLLLHEYIDEWYTKRKVKKACARHGDSQMNLFVSYTVSSLESDPRPFALYCDQTYEELLEKCSTPPHDRRDKRLLDVQRRNFESARVLFSTSSHCVEHLQRRHPAGTVFPTALYGINLFGLGDGLETPLDSKRHSTSIVFVSRMFEERGADILIQAVELLHAEGMRSLTLDMVGLKARPRWQRPWINWHGTYSKDDPQEAAQYWRLMKNARLFVMPSRVGPLPGVIREAQYVYTPVVSSTAWTAEQLIEDGVTGRLVGRPDPSLYAAVMANLINDDDMWTRLAVGGHAVASRETWGSVGRTMRDVLWPAPADERPTGTAP